jgi:PAS domain-containing protein
MTRPHAKRGTTQRAPLSESLPQATLDALSARKQVERDLLASEMRYRRLFESAKDGILILDADTGQIVDVNPFLIDLLGYPYKEHGGKLSIESEVGLWTRFHVDLPVKEGAP